MIKLRIKMRKLFWNIQVGLKCNHSVLLYKGEAEINWRQKSRRQCDYGFRDWSDVATSKGMWSALKDGGGKKQIFF